VRANAPAPAAEAQAPAGHASPAVKQAAPAAPVKLIDINSASRAQLKTLPGIGDAEADKIIAGRPYLSKVHLVTEAGLPTGVYLSIRRQIVAVQNKEARAKLKTLASAQQAQPR
jgi:predicted DNA-binding helix-hairpin-helix protein